MVIRRRDKHAFAVHSGNRRLVTTIEFVSSRGKRFRPMIIFQGAKIQKQWVENWSEPIYAHSEKGWTDDEHGVSWLEKSFDPQTKDIGGRRLLFVDGHTSHVSAAFIASCWDKKIVPLCLPPHTTHFLQPLDVGCFGPLDKAYKKALEEKNATGVVEVDKIDFLSMLRNAREKVLTQTVIMSGWAAAGMKMIRFYGKIILIISGIYPFDPDAVISKLPPRTTSFMLTSSFSSTDTTTALTNREILMTSLGNLNPYSSTYKIDLRRIKSTINLLFSDIDLSRDSTRRLFKANVARQSRKDKKQKDGATLAYDGTAFGRVLTEEDAKRYKEEEEKKAEQVRLDKELREDRKIANATKRLVKEWEVEERKKKRAELKALKELQNAQKPKRIYRKKPRRSPLPPSPTPNSGFLESVQTFGPFRPEDRGVECEVRSPTPSMGGYVYPK